MRKIIADFRSEDEVFDFHLTDITDYLNQASAGTILEMAEEGWFLNDYQGTNLASYFAATVPAIASLLEYCVKTAQGFEVEIDEDAAMEWMKAKYPVLAAQVEEYS